MEIEQGEGEIGWDLGTGTLYSSACTWTNIFSSNKIQTIRD